MPDMEKSSQNKEINSLRVQLSHICCASLEDHLKRRGEEDENRQAEFANEEMRSLVEYLSSTRQKLQKNLDTLATRFDVRKKHNVVNKILERREPSKAERTRWQHQRSEFTSQLEMTNRCVFVLICGCRSSCQAHCVFFL
jgi:hypothetical protein